jgi:MHS family proline/betaine transporter-like MFS transporter
VKFRSLDPSTGTAVRRHDAISVDAPAGGLMSENADPDWRSTAKFTFAGIAGNVLEWYDFAVYGYFAAPIGRHFFPSDDPAASLIAAFGVFAAGFVMRPVGGLVFGYIGDKLGRHTALLLSVLAMVIPTFLIGVLPDHSQIGAAAPIALVVLRMIQGLSVGGEYTTSVVFLVESAPPGRRGLIASASPLGATIGTLIGSAAGSLTSLFLTTAQIDGWGWRLPFLAGLIVGIGGLLLRRHLPESPPHPTAQNEPHSPIAEAFRRRWRNMVQVAGLNGLLAVGFYLAFVYAVTFLENVVHIPTAAAFDINTLNMVVLLVIIPAAGHLSDKVGRKPVLMTACTLGVLLAWPLLWLMHHQNLAVVFAGQFGLAVIVGLFSGVVPVTMAEALPPRVRCTAMSVSYNLCVGVLGGLTPMIATYLIRRTGNDLSPAFFLMAAAAISVASVFTLRETVEAPAN